MHKPYMAIRMRRTAGRGVDHVRDICYLSSILALESSGPHPRRQCDGVLNDFGFETCRLRNGLQKQLVTNGA